MRFLHTSDWHVGRTVRGRSRDSEHAAVLAQVLAHARENDVDCVLVAGDIFDTSAPSAEAERTVFDFFRELYAAAIPAVLIAGNHDHPGRFEALAPLLSAVRLTLLGTPREVGAGGIVEVQSRDGRERALIAALPWVPERTVVPIAKLRDEAAVPLLQYADQLAYAMDALAQGFRPDAISVMVAHVLVNNALIGQGGGERALHLDMGIYGINPERIPTAAQYVALGHVHKPQNVRLSPRVSYSGSLLQLDFGEAEQDKSVSLVELHVGQPAQVERLPITAGRPLRDIGSPGFGIALRDIPAFVAEAGDAWLRVFVDVDVPLANLAAMVRDQLPNAVHIERVTPLGATGETAGDLSSSGRPPRELFAGFYASKEGRGFAAAEPTLRLFDQLLDEASHETS